MGNCLTGGIRLGATGGESMKSYGTVMLLTAMEFQESATNSSCTTETGSWPCSHNEGDLHWKNQCTIGDCLSEATGAAERSLEQELAWNQRNCFRSLVPKSSTDTAVTKYWRSQVAAGDDEERTAEQGKEATSPWQHLSGVCHWQRLSTFYLTKETNIDRLKLHFQSRQWNLNL